MQLGPDMYMVRHQKELVTLWINKRPWRKVDYTNRSAAPRRHVSCAYRTMCQGLII